ncbi:MAG: SNF2-related protein [Thermaerobacterales bacterium]
MNDPSGLSGFACRSQIEPLWRRAGVISYPHQIATARRVVEQMSGRAILADEVGLGKTIEAGLVTRELMARGQVKQFLVLTPASLIGQWQAELAEKFGLECLTDADDKDWCDADGIVISIDLAKREPYRERLAAQGYDLVIVDEAHRLKNRRTLNHHLVRDLNTPYLLLLSATPLQNDLTELYSLITLLHPRVFGSFESFWRRFLLDKRTPRDPAQLREILAGVMVRHRRQDLKLDLPERSVTLVPITLFPKEQALYAAVTKLVRSAFRRRDLFGGSILPLLTLQREVCSSAHALAETLERARVDDPQCDDLLEMARSVVDHRKAWALAGLIPELDEKVIVFTEFVATQRFLMERLAASGYEAAGYHGQMSRAEKSESLRRFANSAGVLVSTECGGQGLNLQFCRTVINYDLPWNPMRVEQRIGRVHRLGQKAARVRIYNLCASGTIEEHILRLLDEKIELFRQVVGELDVILRHLERRKSIEGQIAEITLSSATEREVSLRFDMLGAELINTRKRIMTSQAALPASLAAVAGPDGWKQK